MSDAVCLPGWLLGLIVTVLGGETALRTWLREKRRNAAHSGSQRG